MFNKYYQIQKRLKLLHDKLESETDTRKSIRYDTPKSKGGGIVGIVEISTENRARIEKAIAGLEEKAEEIKQDILLKIESIDDSLMRLLLYWRCIEFKSWESISKEIGKESDALRKYYKRGAKKWNLSENEILTSTKNY